jgi:hypothetical protein
MWQMGLQAHNPRHRELFFTSFVDFYCNGGFVAIIAGILKLLGIGLLKPGSGAGGGAVSSKSKSNRGLRAIQNDLDFIKNKANYENMSQDELKDLVHRVLRSLEFNMPGNHELHGRNLFLQLIGLVDCSPEQPQPPENQAPLPQDDEVNIQQGSTGTVINVLGNDSDPDAGDTLTVKAVTQPGAGKGSVAIDTGGKTITYTPPSADFCGVVTFTYTVSDGKANVTANVKVNVACTQYTVTAVDDTASIVLGTAFVDIPVLGNDSTTPPNGPLSVSPTLVTYPSHGTAVRLDDNQIRYTPTVGYCGADTFRYMAMSVGGQAKATVKVDVKCVIANRDTKKITPGASVEIDVLANDIQYPTTSPLTIKTVTQGLHGTVETINDNSKVRYTHVCERGQKEKCGGVCDPQCIQNCCCDPEDTFTYTIGRSTDGLTSTATVTVTMDCPVWVFANTDSTWTDVNKAVNIYVLKNDYTVPAGKPLTVSQITSIPKNGGKAKISTDGTFITYTPPSATYEGPDSFWYEAKSETKHAATAKVYVTVVGHQCDPSLDKDCGV